MKKNTYGIIVVGLLLLVSCGPKEGMGPTEVTGSQNTPTPIVVPTCTPTISPVQDPVLKPTATPTAEPTTQVQPSETVVPTETPTEIPVVTNTIAPTETPVVTNTPTPSPTPTNTPVPSPLPSPEPTEAPTSTPTPSPSPSLSPSPEPTATPTPVVVPETLVTNGWQKSISIDGKYAIIFPEVFRESMLTRTERELEVRYSCVTEDISFTVCYKMQKKVREVALDILADGGIIVDEVPEEKRVYYLWKQGDTIQRGVLIELPYSQTLLGSSFGEEEWVTGVMQVVFSYPAELSDQYETAQYQYYVIENREE